MGTPVVRIGDRQFTLITKALADPKRVEILRGIAESSEAPSCTCVQGWTGLSPATVSHHLKELRNAGLIHIERSGNFARITLRRDVWNAWLTSLSAL